MGVLETAVGDVLAKTETGKINFALSTLAIDGNSFKGVKKAVDDGKIKVVYDAQRGSNSAAYRYTANTLFVGFNLVNTQDRQALVIHECTHAACDIAAKALLVTHSEAAAYIAQCQLFYYLNEAALSSGKTVPTFQSAILTEAWPVAMKARTSPTLADGDIAKLIAAISADPVYKERVANSEAYDGV